MSRALFAAMVTDSSTDRPHGSDRDDRAVL